MEDSAISIKEKAAVECKNDKDALQTKRDRDEPTDNNVTKVSAANDSDDNKQSAPTAPAVDSFLASMTFAMPAATALEGRGGCDCDECGGSAFIPQAIVDAIRKHKRQKHETMPMKRSQHRAFLQRHNASGVAVDEWTLPLNAEPLVEFGSTHRIVWIRRLPRVLKAIGKGIVGSQQEERQRQRLEWKQGDMYLVPSNGGKAIALIHSSLGDDDTKSETQASSSSSSTLPSSTGGGHAILYICKIPLSQASNSTDKDSSGGEDDAKEWHDIVKSTCQQALENFQNENTQKENTLQYQRISEQDATLLKEALSKLNNENA